jgi:hypothetical protein
MEPSGACRQSSSQMPLRRPLFARQGRGPSPNLQASVEATEGGADDQQLPRAGLDDDAARPRPRLGSHRNLTPAHRRISAGPAEPPPRGDRAPMSPDPRGLAAARLPRGNCHVSARLRGPAVGPRQAERAAQTGTTTRPGAVVRTTVDASAPPLAATQARGGGPVHHAGRRYARPAWISPPPRPGASTPTARWSARCGSADRRTP